MAPDDEYQALRRLDEIEARMHKRINEAVAQVSAAVEANTPTLRDRFAMAALTGMCAWGWVGLTDREKETDPDLARRAYHIADSMLAARTAPPEAEEGK